MTHTMKRLPLYRGTSARYAYVCTCGHVTVGSTQVRAWRLRQMHLEDPASTPEQNLTAIAS